MGKRVLKTFIIKRMNQRENEFSKPLNTRSRALRPFYPDNSDFNAVFYLNGCIKYLLNNYENLKRQRIILLKIMLLL